jgi:predicted alpha/beta superfamily hydrolase
MTTFYKTLTAMVLAGIAIAGTPAVADPLVIGETFTLKSDALNEVRRINVYLPPDYTQTPTTRLPVLYMPDGGLAEDFLHVAGLVQVSTGNATMRPFILVGIENTQRRRDLTGPTEVDSDKKIAPHVGGSAQFRAFLRDELIPQINKRYRTTNERAIVGESLAGLFVVETLMLEPDLFDTYIAFDPSVWWNNQKLITDAPKILDSHPKLEKTLYIGNSSDGVPEITEKLIEVLTKHAPAGVHWHFEKMPKETHATIFHPGAILAFRSVFAPQAPKK